MNLWHGSDGGQLALAAKTQLMEDFSVEAEEWAGRNGKSMQTGFFYCKCEYTL